MFVAGPYASVETHLPWAVYDYSGPDGLSPRPLVAGSQRRSLHDADRLAASMNKKAAA